MPCVSCAPGILAALMLIGSTSSCSCSDAAKNGWFAARPSGTENIYKIYAESFLGREHLNRIIEEAQHIVDKALT